MHHFVCVCCGKVVKDFADGQMQEERAQKQRTKNSRGIENKVKAESVTNNKVGKLRSCQEFT